MRFKMLGGIRLSIYSSICISAAGIIMSFFDKLLGRPLSTSQEKKHKLTVITGVPALGLDALASTAYGCTIFSLPPLPLSSPLLPFISPIGKRPQPIRMVVGPIPSQVKT